MKKIITLILIIMMINIVTVVYGANESCKIGLTSNKTDIKPGEEVEITLNITELQNMEITAWQATLKYDTNIFEAVESKDMQGLGNSENPTYNAQNGKMVATTNPMKSEGSIVKIKLKAKTSAPVGTNTTVSITNLKVADDQTEITAGNAINTLNIVSSNIGSNTNNNGGSSGSNNSSVVEKTSSSAKDTKNSVANTKLPKAGKTERLLVAIITLLVIGIYSYVEYRTISKKTSKR